MADITKQLGKQIRTIRNVQGISQEELAFKSGISAAHLGQIERGLKAPTIITIEKIASALEVSLSTLFSFDNIPIPVSSSKLNGINAYISNLSDDEIDEIYKIIRAIINLKNK